MLRTGQVGATRDVAGRDTPGSNTGGRYRGGMTTPGPDTPPTSRVPSPRIAGRRRSFDELALSGLAFECPGDGGPTLDVAHRRWGCIRNLLTAEEITRFLALVTAVYLPGQGRRNTDRCVEGSSRRVVDAFTAHVGERTAVTEAVDTTHVAQFAGHDRDRSVGCGGHRDEDARQERGPDLPEGPLPPRSAMVRGVVAFGFASGTDIFVSIVLSRTRGSSRVPEALSKTCRARGGR